MQSNKHISDLLLDKNIEFNYLRELIFIGDLKSNPENRAKCWMILLGYLPTEIEDWNETISLNKSLYEQYLDEMFIKNDENQIIENETTINNDEIPSLNQATNHPLSKDPFVPWNVHFKDKELWNTIEKDTLRTRNETLFFREYTKCIYPKMKRNNHNIENKENIGKEKHYEVLTRILFIYAKTHYYVGYVQGMNEILATIYYCFSLNKDDRFINNIESDTYTCFSLLMSEIKENFTRYKDCSLLGFKTRLKLLDKMLKKIDPKLWDHFHDNCICIEIYSTRWLLLLFTQDFKINDILVVWDAILCYHDKQEFINYLSISILLSFRKQIIESNFEIIHDMLKKIHAINIEECINKALSLSLEFNSLI